LENGRAEEEEVDGEYVIWWCSRRTGNGSYDGVKPDKGNKEAEVCRLNDWRSSGRMEFVQLGS
jgi:hypothetical protein